MKILIDMNLSPTWVPALQEKGIEAVHWSTVGDPKASDRTIMKWAKDRGYAVFTNDLDFGTLLAATQAESPSVIQVRTQNLLPDAIGDLVIGAFKQFRPQIESGVLISIDPQSARVRILPIRR
jgi:predicted nuclease of predicted toxin-antitoxin system